MPCGGAACRAMLDAMLCAARARVRGARPVLLWGRCAVPLPVRAARAYHFRKLYKILKHPVSSDTRYMSDEVTCAGLSAPTERQADGRSPVVKYGAVVRAKTTVRVPQRRRHSPAQRRPLSAHSTQTESDDARRSAKPHARGHVPAAARAHPCHTRARHATQRSARGRRPLAPHHCRGSSVATLIAVLWSAGPEDGA